MTPTEIQAAFKKNKADKPFLVYKDPKTPKPVLVIGVTVKFEAARVKADKAMKIEGQGICYAIGDEQNEQLVFRGRQVALTPNGKAAITGYCRAASYPQVLFHDPNGEGSEDEANGTDGALAEADGAPPTPNAGRPLPTPPAPIPNGNPPTAQRTGTFGAQTVPVPPPRDLSGSAGPSVRPTPPPVPPRSAATASAPPQPRPPSGVFDPVPGSSSGQPDPGSSSSQGGASSQSGPNLADLARTPAKRVLPPAVTALPTPRVDLGAAFAPEKLAAVKKNASRFGMKMGAFEDVFNGVSAVADDSRRFAQLSGSQHDPKELNTVRTLLLKKYEATLATLKSYDPEAVGPTVSESMRQERERFRDEAAKSITRAIDQIKFDQRTELLNLLSRKNNKANGGLTDKEEGLYHEKRAELLMMATGQRPDKADEGTGDVRLIRDASGQVAYAFKSIAGESEMMKDRTGVGTGGGTGQEILTSKMSDVLESVCGFKSGHPKSTFATLPVSDQGGDANVGALIEGVPGASLEEVDDDVVTAKWAAMDQAEKDAAALRGKAFDQKDKADAAAQNKPPGRDLWDDEEPEESFVNLAKRERKERILSVPAKDVQRILLMNLATVNQDSKWASVMTDGQSVRPIDGGGAMVPVEAVIGNARSRLKGDAFGKNTGPINPVLGDSLLYNVPGGEHPAARAPLDPEFVNQFKDLDVDKVRDEMNAAVVSIQGTNPVLGGAISAANAESALVSLECIKDAINENPTATTGDFLKAYQAKLKAALEAIEANG